MSKADSSSSKHSDEEWMARALELARQGEALAHPNPMVGAVLVRDGELVSEAFHTYDGVRHAEVIALEQAGRKAQGATLYINLEPCCHRGRTGPCVEAVLAAGVRRVVAAMHDPNPAVAGKGLWQLRRAGVEVKVGVAEAEACRLNEDFAKWIREHTPLVTLKAAMTLDGQIAARKGRRRRNTADNSEDRWITSEESRREVQQMRHRADAVLTGIGTVLADDPLLTDRTARPRRKALLRVVVDSRLRLPLRSKLVQTAAGDVVVFTTAGAAAARALSERGVEVVRVRGRQGRPDLRAVMAELGQRQILNLLVEAGATLNWVALKQSVADKLFLFYAPKMLGPTVPVLAGHYASLTGAARLKDMALHRFGSDFAVEGYLRDVYRHC